MALQSKKKTEVQVRPPLDIVEKEEMLAVLIRNREAYEAAAEQLTVEAVRRCSEPLAVIWSEVRRFHKQYAELPDKTQLIASLHTTAAADPGALDEDELREVDEFIEIAFDDAERGCDISTSPTHRQVAIIACKSLLEEHAIHDFRDSLTRDRTFPVDLQQTYRDAQTKLERIGTLAPRDVPSVEQTMGGFDQWLGARRGKPLGGLATGAARFDQALDGLKGLTIIGGNSGAGKTSRCLWAAKGILENAEQNDAVVVIISADMDRDVLIARMICALADVPSTTFTRGSPVMADKPKTAHPHHTKADHEKIQKGREKFLQLIANHALVIVGAEAGQGITAGSLAPTVRGAKLKSGRKRALLIVDYLQLLRAPDMDEIAADRHRIDQLHWVIERGRKDGDEHSAVVAISEMRKRGADRKAGDHDSADLYGSTRIGYSADAVLLTSAADADDMAKLYSALRGKTKADLPAAVDKKRKELANSGVVVNTLNLAKGRDGTNRGAWMELFHFNTHRFEEAVAETHIPSPDADGTVSQTAVKKKGSKAKK